MDKSYNPLVGYPQNVQDRPLINTLGIRAASAILTILLPVAAVAGQPAMLDANERRAHSRTCAYFAGRSALGRGTDEATLNRRLAVACEQALSELTGPADTMPGQRKRARVYLQRLNELKSTVTRLNVERMFDVDPARNTLPGAGVKPRRKRLLGTGSVTATSEYLIAREIGVLAAYRDWVSAIGTDLALASGSR